MIDVVSDWTIGLLTATLSTHASPRQCFMGVVSAFLWLSTLRRRPASNPTFPPRSSPGPFIFLAMPLIQLTAEESQAALASLKDDLACLFTDFAVPIELRAALGHVGLNAASDLANYETEEQKFRDAISSDVGLVTDNPKARIAMGRLVEAWKSIRNRMKAQDDEAAIARAQGRPAPLPETTFTSMRRGWQGIHGDRADNAFPSRYYVNRRLRQIETGELRAEKLVEVVTVVEGGDDEDDRDVDLIVTANSLRAQRKTVTVPLPSTPEQLRHRIDLMQIQWDMVLARHSDRRLFASYDRGLWDRHAKHLLGEDIHGFRARGQGLQWADLLEYEYKIRHKAIEWVNKGEKFLGQALTDALKDPDIKQLYFTLPLMTSGKRDAAAADLPQHDNSMNKLRQEIRSLKTDIQKVRQSASSNNASSSHENYPQPPAGKGKKGKGKGGKSKTGAAEAIRTLRGREKLLVNLPNNGGRICYFYNLGDCRQDNCSYAHACFRCGEYGHGVLDKDKCRKPPAPK